MPDLVFRGSLAELQARLALLPLVLTGRSTLASRAMTVMAKSLGVEILNCIKEDFLAKARGGSGADGTTWKPLSEKYVAYHRRHPGLNSKRTKATKAGRGSRPLLSSKQDDHWRAVYASCLRRGDDSSTAAAKAWGAVKRMGGKTIIGQYGKAPVEIGRDTGRLLASLSPGAPDNILDVRPGGVRAGTNVSYAVHFNAVRPIFPSSVPPAWQERIKAVLEAAMPGLVRELLQGTS